MKSFLILLFALTSASLAFGQSAQELYAQGVRTYSGGDAGAAKALFAQALEIDPNHKGATAFMTRIRVEEARTGNLERQLSSVIVPSIEFRDVDLTSALDYLPKIAETESNGKVALNLVRAFPSDVGRERKVNLTLSQVPLTEVLRYVAEMTSLKLEYQAHAVVLSVPMSKAPSDEATVQ